MISIQDFSTQSEAFKNLLTEFVEAESPSTNKEAVDHFCTIVQRELAHLGAEITFDYESDAGDNLIARWNPSEGKTGILVMFHMDTVFDLGTVHAHPVRIENGLLYGPGAQDMKASIAIFLIAMRWLHETKSMPGRPITALFTSDEETGSDYSRHLIEDLASRAELVLCMEPALPDGSLKTARKGTGDIQIVTVGKAAHAGSDHAQGRNAIEELAHHILAVQKLTEYDRGTTVSVGVISGGTRTNVVPEHARAQVDFRVATNEEADRIRKWASQEKPVLDGAKVSITVRQDRPPMPRDDLMAETFIKAQSIAKKIGQTLGEGSTGGGSDANYVAPLGVPVLDGLGAIGDGAHSEREYVKLDSLPERAALLAAILTEW